MKDLKKEKENLKRELTEKESQIKDLEVHYQEQFEQLQEQLEEINKEMDAKKKIVNAANESLILKVVFKFLHTISVIDMQISRGCSIKLFSALTIWVVICMCTDMYCVIFLLENFYLKYTFTKARVTIVVVIIW